MLGTGQHRAQVFTTVLSIITILIGIGTLIATYSLAILLGHTEDVIVPYISLTIDYTPESCVGCVGLSTFAFLGAILVIFKHRALSPWVDGHHPRFLGSRGRIAVLITPGSWSQPSVKRVATAAFIVGLVTQFSLNAVVGVQFHNMPRLHIGLACLLFNGCCVYMILQTAAEFSCGAGGGAMRRLRMARLILLCVALFGLIPFMSGIFVTLTDLYTVGTTISASAEITMSCAWAFYVFSFAFDLRTYYCGFYAKRALGTPLRSHSPRLTLQNDFDSPHEVDSFQEETF